MPTPPHVQIELPIAAIQEFCRKWRIRELALFGSVLRDDFRSDSDVDVLVTFAPGAAPLWTDRVRMAAELSAIFGHPVDLVERRLIEESPNYIRRREILNSAEVIYQA